MVYSEKSRLEEENHHLKQRVNQLEEALKLILPLAKGYCMQNKVGSNETYIKISEKAMEDLKNDR